MFKVIIHLKNKDVLGFENVLEIKTDFEDGAIELEFSDHTTWIDSNDVMLLKVEELL